MFDNMNPLWLPKGSVRAILALGVVTTYSVACVTSKNYEALGLISVMIMKDYFAKKDI